ncbi:glycerophosphodiester phosphodiesterase family protein, partial [Streptomyces glaucescens]
RPAVIAHRGASAYAPENTLAAVDKAAELGIEWVENDVQRTKDGELVVIHDDSLRRTTDVETVFPDRAPWQVRDFTAAEIARLDAGSWFGPAYAGAR